MTSLSLPDKVLSIHRLLVERNTPHAFGGALALAAYSEPRATVDIDVNIFVPPTEFPDIRDALGSLGVEADVAEAVVMRDGQCRLSWDGTRVDLFFANDPLHTDMQKATRKMPFIGVDLPILSPEHLIVCKAMFDRTKDWVDIEQMLILTSHLDLDEIDRWLSQLGADDRRRQRFHEMRDAILGE